MEPSDHFMCSMLRVAKDVWTRTDDEELKRTLIGLMLAIEIKSRP